MKSPVEKMIEGKEYTFYYLNPLTAVKLLSFMTKTVGNSFTGLKDLKTELSMDMKITGDLIGMFVEKLMEFDEDKAIEWIKTILDQVHCDGAKVTPINFQGDLMTMFKVVACSLEVNFGDFLGVLQGANAKVNQFKKTLIK